MNDLIRGTNLYGYDALVAELGGEPRRLRARFDIAPDVEKRDDDFVSFDRFNGLVAATALDRDCPDFGMRLAGRQGIPVLGPVAVIARNAATVGEAIAAIARYMPAHSPALRLLPAAPDESGEVRIEYRATRQPPYDMRQSFELAMANAVLIVRLLSGDTAGPSRIWLPHPQVNTDAVYDEHLGCPVTFDSGWCGLAVAGEVMARAIDAADPQTSRLAMSYLESAFPETATLASRVAELVRRLLPTGQHAADVVADHLHLHRRTLQRRLLAEGITYAEILDEQRRALAVRYLAEPEMQVGQVSVLLGYTEQSAFNRAFKRWFATSPRAFRADSSRPRP